MNQRHSKDVEDPAIGANPLSPLSPGRSSSVESSTNVSGDSPDKQQQSGGITAMGLKVLILLAVQNSSKNLLMRFVMKGQPKFLTSAAVIGSECTKLTLSTLYILLIERKSP